MRAHPDLPRPAPSLAEHVRATLAAEGAPPSRARVEAWIRAGAVRVDGATARDPALLVEPAARISVDLDDLDAGTVPQARGARGAVAPTAARTSPPGVLFADAHLVVVERGAFPGALTPDALAEVVSRRLSARGARPLALVPVPDPSAPGSGPVLLATSKAGAARLSALVEAGRVRETLLSLRTPPTLGPGESILEQGATTLDGAPLPWALVERSESPLAPRPPGTRDLVAPHRALLTLKHPKTNRLLEFVAAPPAGWPWNALPKP